MKTTATPLVFVTLYVSLGDGDGTIEGSKAMPEAEWNSAVEEFQTYLSKHSLTSVYNEGVWGGYEVSLENYSAQPITPDELAVIHKFMGDSSGNFRLPLEFI